MKNPKNRPLLSLSSLALLLFALAWPTPAGAQDLRLKVDADAFFIDNEFEGYHVTGYTLPGAWVRPAVVYNPLEAIHLELGVQGLFYSGATRYPCYAYHDVALWKGEQYQRGIHAVPWFRADAKVGPVAFTLGNLHRDDHGMPDRYGSSLRRGRFHDLALPLYNPELQHSSDPEMGIEVRLAVPRYSLDAWVDWQSYIFQMDTHQEAFIAGVTQSVGLIGPYGRKSAGGGRESSGSGHAAADAGSGFTLTMPLQVLFQHRGGEIDDTQTGTQTLVNLGGGLRADWRYERGVVRSIRAELMGLGSLQQVGHLWPFDRGGAVWGSASVNLWDRVDCRLGYQWGKCFQSICGAPFFGSLKLAGQSYYTHEAGYYESLGTGYYSVGYTQPFATRDGQHRFDLALQLQGYLCTAAGQTDHSLSVGLTFKADMDFLLKDFGKSRAAASSLGSNK